MTGRGVRERLADQTLKKDTRSKTVQSKEMRQTARLSMRICPPTLFLAEVPLYREAY